MVFGESFGAAWSIEPAEWIGESIDGEPWTVGALIPNRYESLLRLHAPEPSRDNWWELYRDLFVLVASLGVRYTTTPAHAWFAIWEGHGFDASTTYVAWGVRLPTTPNANGEQCYAIANASPIATATRESLPPSLRFPGSGSRLLCKWV